MIAEAKCRKRKVQSNDWQRLVSDNLPLVKYVMGKLSKSLPPSVDRDDLLAAGSLGLTEAAKRYDKSRNVPFHSYAIPRIWGAMLDELRSHDWLSSDAREQVTAVRRATDALTQEHGKRPALEEIAEKTGFSVERTSRLMMLSGAEQHSSSGMDNSLEVEESGARARLGLGAMRGPYDEAEFNDQKDALAQLISMLPERERKVIMLRYHEELMLHEIGAIMGVTESRVCQIHTQAVSQLKKGMLQIGLSA